MFFAERMGLRPGDTVVTPKSTLKIVEHYVIYMGIYNGDHWYIENNNKDGVRWINDAFFIQDNPTYFRIRKFSGNEIERFKAIEIAKSYVGTHYDLARFNCEHLANTIQYGNSFSNQVGYGIGAIAVVAGIVTLFGLAGSSK